jgi:hypothetical protein
MPGFTRPNLKWHFLISCQQYHVSTDMSHIPCLYILFYNRNTSPILPSSYQLYKGYQPEHPAHLDWDRPQQQDERLSDWLVCCADSCTKRLASIVKGKIKGGPWDFQWALGLLKATWITWFREHTSALQLDVSVRMNCPSPHFFSNLLPPLVFLTFHDGWWSQFLCQLKWIKSS